MSGLTPLFLLLFAFQTASTATITTQDEPGIPLRLEAVVVNAESGKPISGAQVYVYHTDARGLYSPDGSNASEKPPRLQARIVTDAEGRFAVRTIRPASYPESQVPQHVHYEISADGYRRLVGEVLFEGDPLLTASSRANAQRRGWPIVDPEEKEDGSQACSVRIALQPRPRNARPGL